ncbi:MAG: MFS transporter [Candidatus Methylacidiphilales bacterium]|nr:MFS transporter [Candidatus Methylacidiphilales bacterium]
MINRNYFRTDDGKDRTFTFVLVSSLFFLWGFCNGMIDVMDRLFQKELNLSLSQSAWVQFAHYLGYFLMALPAGWLAQQLGYRGGIILGLLIVAAGGFWFLPATQIATFWAFLLGVCLIAAGLTFLETVANPYTTVLGPKEYGASRINLAQSCNGLGQVLGPLAGSIFFYGSDAQGKSTGIANLWMPYVAVAVLVVVLAFIFFRSDVPDIVGSDEYGDTAAGKDKPADEVLAPATTRGTALTLIWLNLLVLSASVGMIVMAISAIFDHDESHTIYFLLGSSLVVLIVTSAVLFAKRDRIDQHSIWMHPHFSTATITQFFYVAAQASIFAYIINFLTSQAPMAISDGTASNLVSVAAGLFLAGRFIGSGLLKQFAAHHVLVVFSLANILMCILIILKLGWISLIAIFLSYFFMSIMFPTIFALGIFGLGQRAKGASAYIVMAIMGGAIMPKLMGHIGDVYDISRGFIVPLVCFGVVGAYAFYWPKLSGATSMHGVDTTKGH